MATKLRCARFLVYSAAELKEAHVPYGMESAMAKMYASDIALEVCNDALQIHGGSGFLKGMEVLGGRPEDTYVFEDSIHGINAGRSAGAKVIGLTTTNKSEVLTPLCDMVIDDFTHFSLKDLM